MEPKYKVGDLVTFVQEEPVWYTCLYEFRKQFLGKTARVIEVKKQIFTKEDLEWYKRTDIHAPLEVFSYIVVFPDEPTRYICISEVHLKLFEMER